MSATSAPVDPFVMVPLDLLAMVADGKLSKNAAWLYVLLLTHLNQRRGDTKVWPSRRKLAERMNLSQTRGVDRYIAELEDAGLIARDRRRDGRVNDTNLYTLRLTCSGGSALQSTTPRPAKTAVQAGQGVVRPSALGGAPQHARGSAHERTEVVRHSAPELDQGELHEEEQDPPSPLPPAVADAPPRPGKPEEEGAESFDQNPNSHRQQAVRLAEPYATRIRSGQLADLEAQIAAALTRGWSPEALECELAARHDGLNDLGAGLIARIRNLKQPPAPRPRTPEPPAADNERCPLPDHRDLARNCGICWGSVKGGQDPYIGQEHLRPPWWHEVYRRPTRRPRQETRG